MNLHINVHYGDNKHHIIESMFKAFAKAVDMATQIDPRSKDVPSTKGKL
jgi:imidazoleglycerol-phosphate dehydratase